MNGKQQTAGGFANVTEAPCQKGKILFSQRLNYTFFPLGWNQRHVAIEDRRTHWVLGGLYRYSAVRDDRIGKLAFDSGDRDRGCMFF